MEVYNHIMTNTPDFWDKIKKSVALDVSGYPNTDYISLNFIPGEDTHEMYDHFSPFKKTLNTNRWILNLPNGNDRIPFININHMYWAMHCSHFPVSCFGAVETWKNKTSWSELDTQVDDFWGITFDAVVDRIRKYKKAFVALKKERLPLGISGLEKRHLAGTLTPLRIVNPTWTNYVMVLAVIKDMLNSNTEINSEIISRYRHMISDSDIKLSGYEVLRSKYYNIGNKNAR